MEVPPEVTYRGVEPSAEIDALIHEKVDKLDRLCEKLISCRVAVELPNKNITSGNPYRVRIDLRVPPGHELVVSRDPGDGEQHTPLSAVIRHAFDSAQRVLRKQMDQQSGQTKHHPEQAVTAVVDRVLPEEDYGFLRTGNGGQVYFHRNAVLHGEFDRLRPGDGVHHVESNGVKGPQASTVHVLYHTPRK